MSKWSIQYKWSSLEEREKLSMQVPSDVSPVTWVDYKKGFSSEFSAKSWMKNSLSDFFRKEMKKGREWIVTDGMACNYIDLEKL
jgi:hypothetical protein